MSETPLDSTPEPSVWMRVKPWVAPLLPALAVGAFVVWAHHGTSLPVFRAHVSHEPGWE